MVHARRPALSIVVMTQVRLVLKRYELSLRRYRASQKLAVVSLEYADIIQRSLKEPAFDKIKAKTDALVSQLRTSYVYAETQIALARILNSMGIDVSADDLEGEDSKAIGEAFQSWWVSPGSDYF
ncbi:MAG: hypothetical protein HKN43_00150 [Rhodothermales bacterium]|nr:hypothetical protein [Rhodothermales bacterium]